MKDLHIQIEVGRRLRAEIGRTHAGHAVHRANSLRRNDGEAMRMIEDLIASGPFTSRDKMGLLQLDPVSLRAIHKQFGTAAEAATEDEVQVEMDEVKISYNAADEDLEDFVHAHRPKAMRRELPEARAQRNASRRPMVVNGVSDAEARGMLPPSSKVR